MADARTERLLSENERVSQGALFIEVLSEQGATLSSATGFTVDPAGTGRSHLITNRHVVRGRHQTTNECLDAKSGSLPSRLRVHFRTPVVDHVLEHEIPLFDEATCMAIWLEHPTLGGDCDVVALPLGSMPAGTAPYHYDLSRKAPPGWSQDIEEELDFDLANDVVVIGYPFGLRSERKQALWVRGSVASHPENWYSGWPCFLIDSRTRQGQSGSPVFFFSPYGIWRARSGDTLHSDGPSAMFVGVYSGRVNEESDLGFVWTVEAVKAVLEGSAPQVDAYGNPPLGP